MSKFESYFMQIEVDKIPPEDLKTFMRKDGTEGASVNLILTPMLQPNAYGYTHTIFVFRNRDKDDLEGKCYVGKAKRKMFENNDGNTQGAAPAPAPAPRSDDDQMPF